MTSQVWNDTSREELRENLRAAVLGELRLYRSERQGILDRCREIYIDDTCPESERDTFIQFAAAELDLAVTALKSEMAEWPSETDCDRLDRVESTLREQGILLWQVSPCCDSCTGAELPDRIDVIDSRYPGFRDRVRGYAFFIDQSMPESLIESSRLWVYLAYGWFSPNDTETSQELYMMHAHEIACDVCACLRAEGFEVNWDGDFSKKIGVLLNWQRRTLLQ